MWQRIKFWLWWKFRATDEEKTNYQLMIYGTGISKNGKFIDVKNLTIK